MAMFLSSVFWIGLLKIIWVNILLSGDNAVVIALASRALPQKQQRQAIVWGSLGAVCMRIALTLFAVELLQLPWLKLFGAFLLLWIGIGLFDKHDEEGIEASSNLLTAIKTILMADLVMSLDNVLAVAAAAQASMPGNSMPMVVLGLILSVPVVIFGSQLIVGIMQRFPFIITLGAMLIGMIAGEMFVGETVVATWMTGHLWLHWFFPTLGALLVLLAGLLKKQRAARSSA